MTHFCPVCWIELPTEDTTCPRCGTDTARAWQGKSYVEKLIAALRHSEPTTPIRAAWVLGTLRARDAVPSLMELAQSSPDPFLREAAVEALGRIGDARSLALLRVLTASDAVLVRRAARRALRRVGETQDGCDAAVRRPGESSDA